MGDRPRVVIVGAGFGGLRAARELAKAPVEVLMVDRHNYHTFQPLLYQVATSALEPEEIAHNVRGIYHGQENFAFRMATVSGVDWAARRLEIEEGDPIPFDYLILAAGASTNYFGIEGVEEHSFPLKTVPEAINLRSHVIRQFELAAASEPDEIPEGALTFVVVGGGPTGVEMAGALTELFEMVLTDDYPDLDFSQVRVILLEAIDTLLAPFHEGSRRHALEVLRRRGVEVRFGAKVTRATADAVFLDGGERISTRTLIWAAGVRANPLADTLGVEQTRGGRVVVERDLSIPGHPYAFVVGDMGATLSKKGEIEPQLAQVAIQGAKHAAKMIQRRMRGEPSRDFSYFDPGIMATIGRNAAVAEMPIGLRFRGFIAWLMWLFLHLMYLVGFRNRLNVLVNWAWNYFTYDRSARLIFEVEREDARGVSRAGQIESGWNADEPVVDSGSPTPAASEG